MPNAGRSAVRARPCEARRSRNSWTVPEDTASPAVSRDSRQDRSHSSSAFFTDSLTRAYAKFGAQLWLMRKRSMSRSQFSGLPSMYSFVQYTMWQPRRTQRRCQSEMLPMWSNGSQLRIRSLSACLQRRFVPRARVKIFACESMIAFGVPVLPEVNVRNAVASASSSGSSAMGAALRKPSSPRTRSGPRPVRDRSGAMPGEPDAVRIQGPSSKRMTWHNRSSSLVSAAYVAGTAEMTGTSPPRRQPQNAGRMSSGRSSWSRTC